MLLNMIGIEVPVRHLCTPQAASHEACGCRVEIGMVDKQAKAP